MPRPVFLGRPIPTATNPISDEVGGSIALGNGNVLAFWQQDRLEGNAFVSEGFNIRIIDSVARTVGAVIALDLGPDSARHGARGCGAGEWQFCGVVDKRLCVWRWCRCIFTGV